jgi:Flp pilus assembly pilin Flp
MLDQMRPQTLGRRKGASTTEYSLLLAAIATVVALVAFAFGNYLHSTLHSGCADVDQVQAGTATCVPPGQH